MSPRVAELIAALPELGYDEEGSTRLELAELGRGSGPEGSLRRIWALGGLQAQVAAAYLAYWVRGWFQDADRRERELADVHLRAALKVLRTMVYLRGAVMKLGQTLASYPDILPDPFVETLERLHFEAPPMHFALLREQVADELGAEPETVFAEFQTRAFAAASLGQVHRARLRSGEDVAVKIQYPAIGRSVLADFRNLSACMLPLRFGRAGEPIKAQLEEVRQVIERETDYEREAEWQRSARALFHEDDAIDVPRVHDAFSTRRVLTSDYLDGVHIHEFLAEAPSQELRDHFGTLIVLAGCRLHYAGRLLYADPHPGNYLFRDGGRLGFLDFGCVRPYTDLEWRCNQLADRAIQGDEEDTIRAIRTSLGLTENEEFDPEMLALNVAFGEWMWRPYRHKGPFDFGDLAYLREGIDRFAAIGRARVTAPWLPMNAFIARWYFGVGAMLYRLRARVDVREIYLRERAATGW